MNQTIIKPKIGITTGDINGVGIELIIKTFTENHLFELCTPIVFASNKVINFYKNLMPKEFNIQYAGTKDLNQLSGKGVQVFNCWEEEVNVTPGQINETGGKYGVRSLMVATQCLKDGQLQGLVTNPIHKHNAQTADFKHSGHTPFLKEKFALKDVAMIMCNDSLKVALLSEHIPISEVSKHITTDNIISKVKIIHESLTKDFGIDRPKIAILALNPHASDNGLIGNEEQTQIIPAIEKLKAEHFLVYGPYSADAFFARQTDKNFDCVLAMYHDQGLIPFKSFDHGMGVNFTAGLPIVRTSPDHGTAFDIAGKNLADRNSFLEAMYLCIDIIAQRANYANGIKNKLVKTSHQHNNNKRSREKDEVVQ
jgi:4-hydroxythreonine-4-phosphate dehydrogenase